MKTSLPSESISGEKTQRRKTADKNMINLGKPDLNFSTDCI